MTQINRDPAPGRAKSGRTCREAASSPILGPREEISREEISREIPGFCPRPNVPGQHHAAVELTEDTTLHSLSLTRLRYVLVTEVAVVISTARAGPVCETHVTVANGQPCPSNYAAVPAPTSSAIMCMRRTSVQRYRVDIGRSGATGKSRFLPLGSLPEHRSASYHLQPGTSRIYNSGLSRRIPCVSSPTFRCENIGI